MVLAFFYSAQPIRFKSRPILDFSSNILYALPAFIAYSQYSNNWLHCLIIIIAYFWCSAMHLFSAIPDITPDKKAGIKTSAVLFGKILSLYICAAFWGIVAIISSYLGPIFLLSFIYAFIPLVLLIWPKILIDKEYWYYPKINGVLGFLLFWYYALRLFL